VKKLVLADQAKADLAELDRATRLRIAAAVQRSGQNNAGNIKKLQGIEPPEYRLRVGDFRVRFSYPDPDTVRVNRVQNRKDAYR
jgi:mRNA-degrading endonuclease RelE of RelBE toxin-antitoxin system